MQIVKLKLSHLDFYCPATGEQIMGPDSGTDLNLKSIKAYWEEGYLQSPIVKDNELEKAWKAYSSRTKRENDGDNPEEEQLLTFFSRYEKANWVVFELLPWTIGEFNTSMKIWLVLDLDVNRDD